MRLALLLGELEQVERPLHVHVVRTDRGELGAGGQQRREVEDVLDLELGQDAFKKARVGDRAGELAPDQPGQRRFERRDVDGDDGAARARELIDEAVTDFAVGARDQYGWRAHLVIITWRSPRYERRRRTPNSQPPTPKATDRGCPLQCAVSLITGPPERFRGLP